jgi:CubicO group peptidase (beta-lactamase class C family)
MDKPTRNFCRAIRWATSALSFGLVASGTAWSQDQPDHVQQQQRMATLHVTRLVEDWLVASGVPGASIALVQGDHPLFLEGFGLADTGTGRKVDPATTIFRVGRLVRAMTATAAMQLVEQGRLSLSADITRRSDLDFLTPDPFGPFTAADLLLHTAGIDHRVIATRAREPEDLLGLGAYLEQRLPPRVRPPGTLSLDSIHGYALLGRLIEIATNVDFSTSLRQTIFDPLAMSNTASDPNSLPFDQLATGYRRTASRLLSASPDYPQTLPASALSTTATDMARWMMAILNGGSLEGHQLLSGESVELLVARQFAHHESSPGRSLAFREGSHFSPRELFLDSTGNGFSAVLVLLPTRRLGLFAAFNAEIDPWSLTYQILDPFNSPAGLPVKPAGSLRNWSAEQLDGYWQDAAVSRSTAEKLVSLVRQDRIRSTADGSLLWREKIFVPRGSGCFQEQDAPTRLCVVESASPTHHVEVGDLVMEKLGWIAGRPMQVALWVIFATLFLGAGWPRASRPLRQPSLQPEDAFPPRWPFFFAKLAAAIHFTFIASLAVLVATYLRSGSTVLLFEVPPLALAVLSLPLAAGALTVVAATGLVPVWRSARASLFDRLRLTGVVAGLAAFLPFLWSWNLLGFRL